MPVTLTGSKYGVLTVSSAGTFNVNVSTTPFVSTDFNSPRCCVLFTSAAVFKGIAKVRQRVSTSQLELLTEFYDPVSGATVTQVVGDKVHVGKNLAECVTTGLTYDAGVATATDLLLFGTTASQDSLVLYDEGCVLKSSGVADYRYFEFNGGVCIFGAQLIPGQASTTRGCQFSVNSPYSVGAAYAILLNGANVHLFAFGGGTGTVQTVTANNNQSVVVAITPKTAMFVNFSAISFVSNVGLNARCVLLNCSAYLDSVGSILKWSGGLVRGGSFSAKSSLPTYSVFASNLTNNNISADPGTRLVIADCNATFPLVRSSTDAIQNWAFTNYVGVPKSAIFASGSPSTLAARDFYFSDRFTSIAPGSVAQVRLTASGALVDSTAPVSGSDWAPSIKRDSWVGAARLSGAPYGPWTYGIKKYGKSPVVGSIDASSYSLGVGGSADNVAFGGVVVQTDDAGVVLSESAAAALTSITNLDDLYDALVAWGCASVSNAAYPTLTEYPASTSGTAISLGALNLVVDPAAGAALAVDTGAGIVTVKAATLASGAKHVSLTTTGTVAFAGSGAISAPYTDATGQHVSIRAPNLVADTRVQLYNVTDAVEMSNVKLTGTGYEYPLVYTADKTIRLRAGYAEGAVAKLPVEAFGVLTSTGLTFLDSQADDAVYNALAIDGSTIAEFATDFPNVQIDVSDPDGETSAQRLYVWAAWIQTSLDGIRLMFRAMSASDTANFTIDQAVVNAKLDNVNASPVKVVGGYLSRKDGSTVIAAASGSIQMDPGKAYLPRSGALVLAADDRLVVTNNGRLVGRG